MLAMLIILFSSALGLECPKTTEYVSESVTIGIAKHKNYLKVKTEDEVKKIVVNSERLISSGLKLVQKYEACVQSRNAFYLEISGSVVFKPAESRTKPVDNAYSSIVDVLDELVSSGSELYVKNFDDAFLIDPTTDQVVLSGISLTPNKDEAGCLDSYQKLLFEQIKSENVQRSANKQLPNIDPLKGHVCILQRILNEWKKYYEGVPLYDKYQSLKVKAQNDKQSLKDLIGAFREQFKFKKYGYIYHRNLFAVENPFLENDFNNLFLTFEEPEDQIHFHVVVKAQYNPKPRTYRLSKQELGHIVVFFACFDFANCVRLKELPKNSVYLKTPLEYFDYVVTAKVEKITAFTGEIIHVYIIIYEAESRVIGDIRHDISITTDFLDPKLIICTTERGFKLALEDAEKPEGSIKKTKTQNPYRHLNLDNYRDFSEYISSSLKINEEYFAGMKISGLMSDQAKKDDCDAFSNDSRVLVVGSTPLFLYLTKIPGTNKLKTVMVEIQLETKTNIIKIVDSFIPKSVFVFYEEGIQSELKFCDALNNCSKNIIKRPERIRIKDGDELADENYYSSRGVRTDISFFCPYYDFSTKTYPFLILSNSVQNGKLILNVFSFPHMKFELHSFIEIYTNAIFFLIKKQSNTLTVFFTYEYNKKKMSKIIKKDIALSGKDGSFVLKLPQDFNLAETELKDIMLLINTKQNTISPIGDLIKKLSSVEQEEKFVLKSMQISTKKNNDNVADWRGCFDLISGTKPGLDFKITPGYSAKAFFNCKKIGELPNFCDDSDFSSLHGLICKEGNLI